MRLTTAGGARVLVGIAAGRNARGLDALTRAEPFQHMHGIARHGFDGAEDVFFFRRWRALNQTSRFRLRLASADGPRR